MFIFPTPNVLQTYQDQLALWGIKDDRIRRPLHRITIMYRIILRFTWFLCLFTISLPGLLLWLPVLATTFYAVHNFKKSGPIWDTWDELAQYKLVYGLISGLCVWIASVIVTLPFASITVILVPALMWMSLRWLEDAVSALRALLALIRLLRVGKATLKDMYLRRIDLHSRVMNLATRSIGLPEDPESYFAAAGGTEKGRVRGTWESSRKYFSVRRRRKRDWNETLRLYDKVDYPDVGQ
jgi:glycerol-3-phosphate O-acyltransferase / dihydroxyacetone phosphate acyltransferase